MGRLIYVSNMSLDGCTEDSEGRLDWGEPSDDLFVHITDLMRSASTYLYGRRMYETMAVWETDPTLAEASDLRREFASVWQAPDKVVYSRTLDTVPTARTSVERDFDPDAVRSLTTSNEGTFLVGGPTLAAQALGAGIVDECHLLVWPVVLAGGKHALPKDVRIDLELIDERRFSNGVVGLAYRVGSSYRGA